MAVKPWNDDRPMKPRIVVGERSVDSRGMSLRFATERIEAIAPFLSRPCIGLAPGANGSPALRPHGVLPVFLP